ncbi:MULTISPECIES: hypothetical protein [unclassified Paenibacillus]|uniref:hypothetical protein n=1 Tax=unclassified Paenibacillus TaxID=185978 RepID=UPI00363BBFD5
MNAKNVLKQNLKKFLKTNSNEFTERVIDIYYQGSLREDLTNGFENVDLTLEGKVITHFCTGIERDVSFETLLKYDLLTDWLIFKKNLMADEEARDMYFILVNVYCALYGITAD